MWWQAERSVVELFMILQLEHVETLKLSVFVCVCVDCGGDGDHAVGCCFSWDSMRVASERLAGRSRLHSELKLLFKILNVFEEMQAEYTKQDKQLSL